LKRRMEKALLFVIALSMLLSMLPGAALGEAQPAAAKSVEEKTKDADTAYLILRESEHLPQLPEGTKPVDKIIPRRCMIVRHNYEFTIPVVIAPVTMSALKDLKITWNRSMLRLQGAKCSASSNRVTLYLTFRAIGKPTDTTQVSYQSLTRKSVRSRTYVTIVPTKVKGVLLTPPNALMFVGQPDLQLEAPVLPKEATNRAVKWYSTNKNVATVSPTGEVTAIQEGTATIYVVTVSGGKKAKCTIEVSRQVA